MEGDITAGNLKAGENDDEVFRVVDGGRTAAGVLGAVTTPVCRLEGLSGNLASVLSEERRGEGCVKDL